VQITRQAIGENRAQRTDAEHKANV
jgi:hypothetical protein